MKQKGIAELIVIALISIVSGLITLQTNKAINDSEGKKIVVYVPKKEEGKN